MMTQFIGSVCVMTLLHWGVSLCGPCDVLYVRPIFRLAFMVMFVLQWGDTFLDSCIYVVTQAFDGVQRGRALSDHYRWDSLSYNFLYISSKITEILFCQKNQIHVNVIVNAIVKFEYQYSEILQIFRPRMINSCLLPYIDYHLSHTISKNYFL